MLERFFEAKSFRFHVPKVIQVPKMIIFEYFGWEIMYVVVYVLCMYCMYCMYVLFVCIAIYCFPLNVNNRILLFVLFLIRRPKM